MQYLLPEEDGIQTFNELPVFRRGLPVVEGPEALLIEGGRHRVLLNGPGAAYVLPRLLRLLNGQHSAPEVLAELGLDSGQLHQLLMVLAQNDLLEFPLHTDVAPRSPGSAEHVDSYLSRMAESADDGSAGPDPAATIAKARVLLVGPVAITGKVADDLTETGITSIELISAASSVSNTSLERAASGRQGIVAAFDSRCDREPDAFSAMVETCSGLSLPVLRIAATPGTIEIGPSFHPVYTACYSCFTRGYEAATLSPARDAMCRRGVDDAEEVSLLSSFTAAEVLAMISHISSPRLARQLTLVYMPDYSVTAYDVTPEPDCSQCFGWQANGAAGTVETYEWIAEKTPSAVINWHPRSSVRQSVKAAALQTRRTISPTAPWVALPAQEAESPPLGAQTAPCTPQTDVCAATIATVLARVAGFRKRAHADGLEDGSGSDGHPRRWAPSGGNLGSVEIYLASDNDITGLPHLILKYDDIGHRLVAAHAHPLPLNELLAGTGLNPAMADFVLIMVSAVGRISEKYGSFSLRLGHLDAGCAATQLSVIATGLGWRVSFASCWPSALGELLQLRPGAEIITAVASVRGVS
jgi:SagB-type dehydrogenase family enzyme